MSEEFSADFTAADNTKAIRCGRTDCPVQFYPAGTEFHYLHSNDPSVPGRAVCTPCYHRYLTKKTTKRRPNGILIICLPLDFLNICFPAQPLSSELGSGSQIHEQKVQQQIVKAQRNGKPAQCLNQDGDNELTCALILAGAASIQHVGATVLGAGTALHTQAVQVSRSSGPFIQLPGFPVLSAPSSRSQTVSLNPPSLGLTPGYNLNHIGYQATRAKMASNAYAGNSGQIILVEVRVVRLPEGKVKPILIGVSFSSLLSSTAISNNLQIIL
jgi:hypothetical protein